MRRFLILSTALTLAACASHAPSGRASTERPGASVGFPGPFELTPIRVAIESHVAVHESGAGPVPARFVAAMPLDVRTLPVEARDAVATDPDTEEDTEEVAEPSVREWPDIGVHDAVRDEHRYERAARLLVEELLGEDRQRMYRKFGSPAWIHRIQRTATYAPRNHIDERAAEAEQDFIHDVLPGVVRRPLADALRSLPWIERIEYSFEAFTEESPRPVTRPEPSEEEVDEGLDWGRLSLRARSDDDPLEVAWSSGGLRVGSSRLRLRAAYSTQLFEDVWANLVLHHHYVEQRTRVRADVDWLIAPNVWFHVTAGEDLQFLASPTGFEASDSPVDGTPGVLFWVQHTF